MIGAFIPWRDEPYRGRDPGWIIDGNGCHIWIGGTGPDGYARVNIKENGRFRSRLVQRIRYEREIGPIPEGLVLDHYVCDNGAGGCCNPRHCRPVTRRENVLRGNNQAAWQLARTHCPRGHPLAGDNLIQSKFRRRGERECRTCHNERQRRRRRDRNRQQQERIAA